MALRPSQLRASAADAARMVPDAFGLASRAHLLKVPLLIVAGVDDRVVDFAHQSKGLAERTGGSTLLGVEGAGHMVHHVALARLLVVR